MTQRRFPPPWRIERLPGGFKVVDAHGQSLAYFYARDNDNDAGAAGVLTLDEVRRMASNFAKLPEAARQGLRLPRPRRSSSGESRTRLMLSSCGAGKEKWQSGKLNLST